MEHAVPHPDLQDPRFIYPRPPYPEHPQRVPGLDAKMRPEADQGENGYEGHDRLRGRRALVTGGDSGIGRAAAIAFAREGADVAIAFLPSEQKDADEVLALIRDAERKAVAIAADISSGEQACREIIEKVVDELGGLDILVNN